MSLLKAPQERLLHAGTAPASASPPPFHAQRFRQVIWGHLAQVKRSLFLAVCSTLAVILLELLSPWPLKIIFDYILLAQPLPPSMPTLAAFFNDQKIPALLLTAALMGLIALLSGAFSYTQIYLTSRIGYQLVYRLRVELFTHLQRLSLSFHHRSQRGELLTKVSSDTAALKEAFSQTALEFISEVLTFTGMFIVMFILDWQLSLIILLSFPILFGIFTHLQSQLKDSVRRQRKNEGKMASQLTEVLTAMLLVQAFGREGYETKRFKEENAENLAEGVRLARLDAAVTRSITIVSHVGVAIVVVLGALKALEGEISPGDVLIFSAYVKSMYKPIGKVARHYTKLTKASISAQRIAEILNIEPDIQDKPDAVLAPRLQGDIVFDHVSFGYETEYFILKDVSFHLAPGQRLALVGASGAGKSTIASLLLRLYDPQKGSICIDGLDIKTYQRHSLRQQIGLVLQEPFLFGATIRENISYGNPHSTLPQIETAARQAHAHEFIMALPAGYETAVGEMGSTLSGGQRQRIAIARALVKEPSILIFDEPTSALDPASTAMIEETLSSLYRDKTTIVIAHNLATIQNFDQILVLHEGQIGERGTHAELVALRGIYYQLFTEQW